MNILLERLRSKLYDNRAVLFTAMLVLFNYVIFAQTYKCTKNLNAANDFFQEQEYESAILKFNKVIKRSNYFGAYYGRALCYYMLGDNSLALIDFYNVDVVSHYQNDTSYFWFRGQTHHRLEQWKEALQDYKQAEQNGINLNAQIGLSIGTVYYFLGQNDRQFQYSIQFEHLN